MTQSAETGPGAAAAALLAARYRGAEPAAALALDRWNPVLTTLLTHRSVRAFLPAPLPAGLLETLVAAAQSAASSSNLQTWSVVAVQDPDRKARLAELAGNQGHIREAPLFLVWVADLARTRAVATAAGSPAEGLDYLESLLVAVIDAALAAQNAVVALESLGLGAVYIGAIRNRADQVAAELGLPPQAVAVFGLAVGYPDPERPAAVKPRLAQSAVLHQERYSTEGQAAAVAAYDAALRDFQQEQQLSPVGWTQTVANRVKSAQSLSGRDRLVEVLRGLGFALR